jgi:endonuclease/exonuclease/phosphatase family metal-dependent hydrolase
MTSSLRASRARGLARSVLRPGPGGAAAGRDHRGVGYNVHSGLGTQVLPWTTRRRAEANLRGIADAIAATPADGRGVDVVALNEVDFGSRRSGWIDQAAFLADALRRLTGDAYTIVRGETWRRRVPGLEVRFGNAMLVRRGVLAVVTCLFDRLDDCRPHAADAALPPLRAGGWWARLLREPRGVIRLTIDADGRPVDVLATHLDPFVRAEREAQAAHLRRRLVRADRTTIVLGDMNAVPPASGDRPWFGPDRTFALLTDGVLLEARSLHRPNAAADFATFPATAPRWPLDWVLASGDLRPVELRVIGGRESDHRGVYVRYRPRTTPGGADA